MKKHKALLSFMKAKRFTIRELAKRIGMNERTLASKISGDRGFSIPEAIKIMKFFGIPMDEFEKYFG